MGVVGKQLRRLRAERGWTLRELASRAGLSHSFLGDVEVGRCDPSVQTLLVIARALGVEPHKLLPPNGEQEVA